MAEAVVDRIGQAYIAVVVIWTVSLVAGMLFLYLNQHLPCLQIRRLPLVFVAVTALHIYGTICGLAYVIQSVLPCSAIFWLMSILLPFGIAMLQISNSQFLHIASRQKQFARMSSLSDLKPVGEKEAQSLANSRWKRIIHGVERADNIEQSIMLVGIGLVVEFLLTLLFFFGSRKFHPSYGFFDYTFNGPPAEAVLYCVTGWEWWLSIVWQFVWAWLYAPYLLWKTRGVRDVHSWRMQTLCSCLAGLPASPLWLAGLYVPQMGPVNKYFSPPTWFALSIFFLELVAIGFPIVQVFKARTLRQETLDAIASWEQRTALSSDSTVVAESDVDSRKSLTHSRSTAKSGVESTETMWKRKRSIDSHKSELYTMAALENALRVNAEPLLEFAALKDFSGENVSFLTNVAEWKRSSTRSGPPSQRQHFASAVRLYASFISLEHSEFPINISSKEMKRLYEIFAPATTLLYRTDSVTSAGSATPFDHYEPAPPDCSSPMSPKLSKPGLEANPKAISLMDVGSKSQTVLDGMRIPEKFGPRVFDAAESEIKYLVLTNTWPKFVNAGTEESEKDKEKEALHHYIVHHFFCGRKV